MRRENIHDFEVKTSGEYGEIFLEKVGNTYEILFQKMGNTYEIHWGILLKFFPV